MKKTVSWQPYIFAAVMVAIVLVLLTTMQVVSPVVYPENETIGGECLQDKDCRTAGCSGQICTTAARAGGMFTTCEMKSYYECYAKTSCGCVSGTCMWKENSEFNSCMENAQNAE